MAQEMFYWQAWVRIKSRVPKVKNLIGKDTFLTEAVTKTTWAAHNQPGLSLSTERKSSYPNFPLSLFLLYHGEGKFYEFAFSHIF